MTACDVAAHCSNPEGLTVNVLIFMLAYLQHRGDGVVTDYTYAEPDPRHARAAVLTGYGNVSYPEGRT